VPVIAAFGGVLFVSEQVSERLLVAAVLTLGGMLLVILRRHFDAGGGRKPKNL
jgi:drug/metabolite transporter (DMT)-like permease